MAGLGNIVQADWKLESRMMGSIEIGGSNHFAWCFIDPEHGGEGFGGDRTSLGSHLEFREGELCSIDFYNRSGMPHTIHLHGLDVDQANDGVPTTSFEVDAFSSYKYVFRPLHAGTFHYHCHVDTVLHYAKGMFGTIIVRPSDGSTNRAWDGGPTFDEEVLWNLATTDTSWNDNLIASGPETARFNPDGFVINGGETAAASTDAMTRIAVQRGQKVYLRLVQSSYQWARVSLDGLPFEIVATDGRPMPTPIQATSWELGPGERYDIMFTPTTAGTFRPMVEYLDDFTSRVIGSVKTELEVS